MIIKLLNKFFVLSFMFFATLVQAQLADFTFLVTNTNETCESNGTLNFSVQNATPNATITYSIFLLPDTVNPIAVTTQNNYTGLNSGNYLIVATQNLLGQNNSQQQIVVILDHVIQLQYQLQGQNAVCINNGKITVIVTQGQAINYEIISGPILKPLQTSNVFTGLSAGVYLIRVYDTCGNGVVQTYTLFESPSSINISPVNNITIIDCENAIINQTINAGEGVIFYPLTILYTITLPNGQTETVSQTLNSGNDSFITISQNIPITIGQTLSYTLSISDGCGNTFNGSGVLAIPTTVPNLFTINNGCGLNDYKVQNATNVVVIEAPVTFTQPLPFNVPTSGNNEYPLTNFPPGEYKLEVTNLCGVVSFITFVVAGSTIAPPTITVRLGCENGIGSLKIASAVDLISAQITGAPANSGFTFPSDISNLLFGSPASISMNNLTAGTYNFQVIDLCGTTHNLSATIQGYTEVKTINVLEHCGSFDLFLNHLTTPVVSMSYHLQKYFENGNYWGHPVTGLVNSDMPLGNNAIKYNIASSGHFRVIGKNFIYGNGGATVNCVLTIGEFDFYSLPKINAVYSFACDAGGFDVYVDAFGIADLNYKIIAKDGIPLLIDNVTDPLFTNLQAGIYTFQLIDGCSNILAADYEVGGTQNFNITIQNLCPQQNAKLSVINFDFLEYQWWKGTDIATILSTTSSLTLTNFNPNTDSGLYHVRIFYSGSPNTCIDTQKELLVDIDDYVLNAGEDTVLSFCGTPGSIDLMTLLNGTPNADGTWQNLSNIGVLEGSVWNATSVNQGIYNFKYTVTGLCNTIDSATLQITINIIPENISIDATTPICAGQNIQLATDFISNASYFWQGPNGFSSNLQNPIIENASTQNAGEYSLLLKVGNCDSELVSITVEVKSLPQFMISGNCVKDNSDYELFAHPADSSLNSDDFSYSWNSPLGNVGTSNPISILGQESGIYSATITDKEGCSIILKYEVKGTVCKIPKGISPNGDGDNDSFNLAGFNVRRLIIYSRYGLNVYEKRNYVNDWHGQDYHDRKLPAATYFYYIETEAGEKLTGWVFVIR